MACYVDPLMTRKSSDLAARRVGARNGHRWCHLLGDSEAEVHALAARIGMRREWYDPRGGVGGHYDLTPPRRARAVELGAIEIDMRGVVALLRKQRGGG